MFKVNIQNEKIRLRTIVQQKETRRSILDARNAEMRQCEYGGHFFLKGKGNL